MTPRTHAKSPGGGPHLIYKTPGGGFFAQGVNLYWDGSVCLDCGYVMLFLRDESLATARQLPSFERT